MDMNTIMVVGNFFGSDDFLNNVKAIVLRLVREQLDPSDRVNVTIDNIYVVTYSFVMGEQKALLSTSLPDGKYYECTYDKLKNMIYVTTYVRVAQTDFPVEFITTKSDET